MNIKHLVNAFFSNLVSYEKAYIGTELGLAIRIGLADVFWLSLQGPVLAAWTAIIF